MLKKARQVFMGNIRRSSQGGMQTQITRVHYGAQHWPKKMLFDRIALERHDDTATKGERLQNAKHWNLRLNADGPQKPL